ncbi:endonuclease domain-containing protein [Marinactinospora thermotolerans]
MPPRWTFGSHGRNWPCTPVPHRSRATRAERIRRTWPKASQFMCAGCLTERAQVWDHCHTHGYVRAPLCTRYNTRHWRGWQPHHGRATATHNIDPTYYRRCPDYGNTDKGSRST